MKVLITGGAGFLGSRLAHTLLQCGSLAGQPITQLMLADLVAPRDTTLTGDARVRTHTGDLLAQIPALMAEPWDAILHLASAVSGECEANFDLGLHANLDTTRRLLDACRAQAEGGKGVARFFFSSSVAVFGSDPALPLPDVVRDDTLPTPQSSYGIHKFVCEQLVADYTRKGFVQGRNVRLMTVSVRPGRPNGAASSFLSGMLREPLAGVRARVPVHPDTAVALSSPASTIEGLLRAAQASPREWGARTAVNLPALTVTVRDMAAALERVAGPAATALLDWDVDAGITAIVGNWPSRIDTARASALGLRADGNFEDVIRAYVRENPEAVKLSLQKEK